MKCRYCGASLSSPASIALGYGADCAKRHDLPHPDREDTRRLTYLASLPERDRMRAIFTRPLRRR